MRRASKFDLEIYERTETSATEEDDLSVMFEWADEFVKTDWVIWFNPCLPLLKVPTINEFIRHLLETDADCMLAAVETKNYFFDPNGKPVAGDSETLNTKTAPILYRAAHAIYATKTEDIRNGRLFGCSPALWPMADDELPGW